MVVLGGVVAVWSGRYLLEQVGDAILQYRVARREQKRAMLVVLFEQQQGSILPRWWRMWAFCW
jgi:hypothetical protein